MEQLVITNCCECGGMHHQNLHCCLTDRQHICCHSLRRHHGGFEYDLSRQQNKEDSNVAGTQECPTVCYYTGDSQLTHAYLQNEPDSCLGDSGSDFGEMCHQQDAHEVLMDTCLQTCDGTEHNADVSHPQTSQRMNEEPEKSEDTLCPCRVVHSRWCSNQWSSVPPSCCNVRNTLVLGVEVDVLEEVVYEDTEIVQAQPLIDGCQEDYMMDSTSCYCDQLFFM